MTHESLIASRGHSWRHSELPLGNSFPTSIRFPVPNHQLYRIAALELLLDGYGNPSPGARTPYLESIQGDAMTAIAPVHVRFPEYHAGQPLGLRQ